MTDTQNTEIWQILLNCGSVFKHLLYAGLRKGDEHKAGWIKYWPKLKGLGAETWDELRFRPLSSYFKFRWKRLLTIGAKWSNWIVSHYKDGYSVNNPRIVVQNVESFCDQINDSGMVEQRGGLLQYLWDIKDFFPSI